MDVVIEVFGDVLGIDMDACVDPSGLQVLACSDNTVSRYSTNMDYDTLLVLSMQLYRLLDDCLLSIDVGVRK